MSFSSDLKEELSKKNNLANKGEVKWELIGYLVSNNITFYKNTLKYKTENEYNINRFSKLLTNSDQQNYKIGLAGKVYWIECKKIQLGEIEYTDREIQLKSDWPEENNIKAFMRGIFLGSGSMNNPEKKYHLELLFSNEEIAKKIQELLQRFFFSFKWLIRKKGYALYLKEGEEISRFLAFMGATQAILKFEEIRVLRDMKNQVNRTVNCETANLNKTVEAAVKQVQAIESLQKKGKWEGLPENLKEIGKLRLENPHASLIELGKLLKEPIGKSGVNHRMQTILALAEKENENDKIHFITIDARK